jgi:putative membrane protein
MIAHHRYFLILSALYVTLWIALAIDPHDRSDWALENALVLLAAIALFVSYKRLLLSRVSYTLIFVFLCLHAIGAHYTYSLVPYDQAFEVVTGHSFNALLGWDRNSDSRAVSAYRGRERLLGLFSSSGAHYGRLDVLRADRMDRSRGLRG